MPEIRPAPATATMPAPERPQLKAPTEICDNTVIVPEILGDIRSQIGALASYYASRIAAARSSGLSGSALAALVNQLLAEQRAAIRTLVDRWQAAMRNRPKQPPKRPQL